VAFLGVRLASEPTFIATAFAVSGGTAVVAYSALWTRRGPGARQAFLLRSVDGGASWSELPLCRTAPSLVRYWGFPVWPPERVSGVALHDDQALEITFADEWVAFEPGGESMWSASLAARGLWTVRRIRKMDYDGADGAIAPGPVELRLPEGLAAPDPARLDRIAQRIALDDPFELPVKYIWLATIPAGALVFSGSTALVALALVLQLTGLGLASILIERRRVRTASLASQVGR
jgi:hypothetical protein